MNFYKKYLGSYAKKTGHLSLTEHGAYNVLLDNYYSTTKPLPASKAELHRICRAMTKAERDAVDKVADQFFPVNGDGTRHNERADEELKKWEGLAEHNRTIGKLGGRPKKKPGNNPDDNPDDNPEITRTVSKTKPGNNPNSEVRSTPKSKEDAARPRDPLWNDGIEALQAAGISQETARSFIAKCLKDWPADVVTDAILEARGTADPRGYAMKLLQGKPKKTGRGADYTAGSV